MLEFKASFQLYKLSENLELKKEINKKHLACPVDINLELNLLTLLRKDMKNKNYMVKVFNLCPSESNLNKYKPYKNEEYDIVD